MQAGRTDEKSTGESQEALQELCQIYWYPLYAFVRRKGHSHADAEELTQGFFAHLLTRNRLQLADQEKGRFRSFLLRSIENFMVQEWRKKSTAKRGGKVAIRGIDFDDGQRRYSLEPTDNITAQKLFDRKWAIQILEQALHHLAEYYRSRDKLELFQQLKPRLVGDSSGSFHDLAERLGMNEIAVKVAAHRMRQRYRATLCELVGQTVDSESGIEQEIADLFSALRRD